MRHRVSRHVLLRFLLGFDGLSELDVRGMKRICFFGKIYFRETAFFLKTRFIASGHSACMPITVILIRAFFLVFRENFGVDTTAFLTY